MKKILAQLKDWNYYYKFAISLISVSFVLFLWLYMKGEGYIEYSYTQIFTYYAYIAIFFYLFIQSCAQSLSSELYKENSTIWLSKQSLLLNIIKTSLLPNIINVTPLFIFVSSLALIFNGINVLELLQMTLLIVISHVGYFFLSFNTIWLTRLFNWNSYGAFALRFIGMTWNGAYIPFLFMNEYWFDIMMKTPYMILGAPFQIILKSEVFPTLLFYTSLHTVIMILLAIIPFKSYKLTQRI